MGSAVQLYSRVLCGSGLTGGSIGSFMDKLEVRENKFMETLSNASSERKYKTLFSEISSVGDN